MIKKIVDKLWLTAEEGEGAMVEEGRKLNLERDRVVYK